MLPDFHWKALRMGYWGGERQFPGPISRKKKGDFSITRELIQ